MILAESMLASLPYWLPICSGLKSFTSDVLHKLLSVCRTCMTLARHQSPTLTPGEVTVELQRPPWLLSENRRTHVQQNQYIRRLQLLSKSMMNGTDLKVIEHVCSDGGAFKLDCACKCFPLIGSQKRFITRGEYRSATPATEKKFNSDLMSCRLEIWVYAHRLSREPLLFVLRCRDFPFFLNTGD